MIDLAPPPLLLTEPFRILRPLEGGLWKDVDTQMRKLGVPRDVRRSVIAEMKRTNAPDATVEVKKKDVILGSMLVNPYIYASATGALDGTSPSGAWSMGRNLVGSFSGAKYTTATGIDSLKDQTGNSRHFDQASTGLQPAVSTAGPNSRACADFDGSDDFLVNAVNNTSLFAAGAAFMVVSCMIDTITTDSSAGTSDQAVFADNGGYTGLALRSSGPSAFAYNFDGNYDNTPVYTLTTGVPLVLTFRRDGTNLYLSKNGGVEALVASGNTGDLAYKTWLARGLGGYMDGKIFEVATWATVPVQATRDAIVADFMAYVGASAPTMLYSHEGYTLDNSNLTTYTFTSAAIGAAGPSRVIAVAVQSRTSAVGTPRSITGVTLGGVSMTAGPSLVGGSAGEPTVAWFYLAVATGTTANIVVTFNNGTQNCAIDVYRLFPLSSTPVDTAVSTLTSASVTLTDLEVKTQGLALILVDTGRSGSPNLDSSSWNGVDTPVHDVTNQQNDQSGVLNMFSIPTTENNTTRDFTGNASGDQVVIAGLSFQ